jgi:hypothetical protein
VAALISGSSARACSSAPLTASARPGDREVQRDAPGLAGRRRQHLLEQRERLLGPAELQLDPGELDLDDPHRVSGGEHLRPCMREPQHPPRL